MIAISAAKNADYTGGSGVDNAFSNFESVETFGVPTLHGFITRMTDKFARISTFVKKGVLEVKDETVSDSLLDLANYSILMAGFIQSKRVEAIGRTAGVALTDLNQGGKVPLIPTGDC